MAGSESPPYLKHLVGLTTLGQPRLSEGAQPYPRQTNHLGSQVSAIGYQVRVFGFGYGI